MSNFDISTSSFGAGDSRIIHNLLPPDLESTSFNELYREITWQTMLHKGGEVPRLIAVQGEIMDRGIRPIYRHPTDYPQMATEWTATVLQIKNIVESVMRCSFNHGLVQYYRSGMDYISEHADKSLDILHGTPIVSVSIGASRVMILKLKPDVKPNTNTIKISLPHNSLFVLGYETNRLYTHSIKQDRRNISEKREDELLYGGQRISITFRNISTFIRPDLRVFGQGATCKTEMELNTVLQSEEISVNNFNEKDRNSDTVGRLLMAFSEENKSSSFDWDTWYGCGFDILSTCGPSTSSNTTTDLTSDFER